MSQSRDLLRRLHDDGDEHVEEDKGDDDVEGPEVDDCCVRRQIIPGHVTVRVLGGGDIGVVMLGGGDVGVVML